MTLALLIASAFVAGALNAVAGGGSFFTFPALIFAGVPPLAANATNTVALVPGSFTGAWAFRHEMKSVQQIRLPLFVAVSLAGGLAGALLLLVTPPQLFVGLIPWLLLVATLVFAFGRWLSARLRERVRLNQTRLLLIQAVISVYGGYFGGGIGILMLAAFSLYGMTDLLAMNAAKNLFAGCLNGIAAATFLAAHAVHWHEAAIMMVTAIIGSLVGANLARRIGQDVLRVFITLVGLSMSVYFYVHRS